VRIASLSIVRDWWGPRKVASAAEGLPRHLGILVNAQRLRITRITDRARRTEMLQLPVFSLVSVGRVSEPPTSRSIWNLCCEGGEFNLQGWLQINGQSVNTSRVGRTSRFQTIAVYPDGILADKKAIDRDSAAEMIGNYTAVRETNRTAMKLTNTWIHVCAATIARNYTEASAKIARTSAQ
jgi:hypothetical protein